MILLDVSGFVSDVKKYGSSLDSLKSVPDMIERALWKDWYDGYDVPSGVSVYNPYSVRNALKSGKCAPYWNRTACVGSLESYLIMDFEGLKQAARQPIAGEPVTVNVDSCQNGDAC